MLIENKRFLDSLLQTFKISQTGIEPAKLDGTPNVAQDTNQAEIANSTKIARAVVLPANPDSIHIDEINEIMPILDHVVDELKGAFATDKYSILIGDDISGRIPTLILQGVINHINATHRRPSIPTRFIDGKFGPDEPVRHRLVHELQALKSRSPNKRALIVTEYLESGNHARNIGNLIHDAGASYDIVAIGIRKRLAALILGREGYYRARGVLNASEHIFPATGAMKKIPDINHCYILTGLRGDNAAKITVNSPKMNPYSYDKDRARMLEARRDVQTAIIQLVSNHRLSLRPSA